MLLRVPVPQYTTQFVQTNVDERKSTKTRMLKHNFLLYHNWTNNKNTKVVMFINFAMHRCVCVCVCKNKNIFSQE